MCWGWLVSRGLAHSTKTSGWFLFGACVFLCVCFGSICSSVLLLGSGFDDIGFGTRTKTMFLLLRPATWRISFGARLRRRPAGGSLKIAASLPARWFIICFFLLSCQRNNVKLMCQAGTNLLRVLQALDQKQIVFAKPPDPQIKCVCLVRRFLGKASACASWSLKIAVAKEEPCAGAHCSGPWHCSSFKYLERVLLDGGRLGGQDHAGAWLCKGRSTYCAHNGVR